MVKYVLPKKVAEIRESIRSMVIRGAGKIARSAVKALMIAAESYRGTDVKDFVSYMDYVANYLITSRPTAVSLPNAVSYVISRLKRTPISSVDEGKELVLKVGSEFIDYSLKAVKIIGELGAKRIENGDVILTHCHSTAAVSVIVTAHKQGKVNKVYVKETRPKYQGLITAKELAKEGIEVIYIPDSAVRYVMKDVDKVVIGADTVAANGAVVNKIGTSVVALVAKEARVRVYVATETYKFSPRTVIGELVPIEVRDPTEVVDEEFIKRNPNVKIYNPSFDVTPPEYIDAIITEKGVIPPHAAILLLESEYGWVLTEYLKVLEETIECDADHLPYP